MPTIRLDAIMRDTVELSGGFSGPGLPNTLRRTSVPVAHCLPLLCFGKQQRLKHQNAIVTHVTQ